MGKRKNKNKYKKIFVKCLHCEKGELKTTKEYNILLRDYNNNADLKCYRCNKPLDAIVYGDGIMIELLTSTEDQ